MGRRRTSPEVTSTLFPEFGDTITVDKKHRGYLVIFDDGTSINCRTRDEVRSVGEAARSVHEADPIRDQVLRAMGRE